MATTDPGSGFHVVIPARHDSTRLPAKPLQDIAGRPMVEWVCRRAQACGAASVTVATDHPDIMAAARKAGAQALMTATGHASGTDRLAEVAERQGWSDDDIVVNLQGDEPAMPPTLIYQVARLLIRDQAAGVSTLCTPLVSREEWQNPNVVKVLASEGGRALYFSRQPIPHVRDRNAEDRPAWQSAVVNRHLGIYGYRVAALRAFSHWAVADLEAIEKLEQLRFMAHDVVISVARAEMAPGPGVDTREDLEHVRQLAIHWR